MTFLIPGTLKRPRRRKPEPVDLYIEAEDRADALWQAHHGVIHATIAKSYPGASIKYDLRKLRLFKVHPYNA